MSKNRDYHYTPEQLKRMEMRKRRVALRRKKERQKRKRCIDNTQSTMPTQKIGKHQRKQKCGFRDILLRFDR